MKALKNLMLKWKKTYLSKKESVTYRVLARVEPENFLNHGRCNLRRPNGEKAHILMRDAISRNYRIILENGTEIFYRNLEDLIEDGWTIIG